MRMFVGFHPRGHSGRLATLSIQHEQAIRIRPQKTFICERESGQSDGKLISYRLVAFMQSLAQVCALTRISRC